MSSFSKDKIENGIDAPTIKNLDTTLLDNYLKHAAADEGDTSGNGYEWVFRHEDLMAMRQAARCESKSVSLRISCRVPKPGCGFQHVSTGIC